MILERNRSHRREPAWARQGTGRRLTWTAPNHRPRLSERLAPPVTRALILDRSAGKESLPFLPPSRLFVFFMVLVARPDQQPDSSARRRESTAAKRALELGKHNDEVFKELGFDLNEIERLSTSGVIPKPAAPAKAA